MTKLNNEQAQVPLNKLVASKDNPRQLFDEATIQDLACSISENGILQNLVVRPKKKGKKEQYEIVCGERRYRALEFLLNEGFIPDDYLVPVDIRKNLTDRDALLLATVENMHREDMTPLEEAEAVKTLLQAGESLEAIHLRTGFSKNVIKQRAVMADLCDEVKQSLKDENIDLEDAQALTLGTHDQQKDLLDRVESGWYSPSRIIGILTDDKICVDQAQFDVELYDQSKITSDLFGHDEDSYFDDNELFFKLQDEAVENLKAEKEQEGFSPVEIIRDENIALYGYEQAEDGEKGGCFIHYHPNGNVCVHAGLVKRDVDKDTVKEITKPKKATYSKPLKELVAMEKSIVVQSQLLYNPRKAKEVALVQMLQGGAISMTDHKCVSHFEGGENASFEQVNTALKSLLEKFGADDFNDFYYRIPESDIYETAKLMTDEELEQATTLLAVITFGQSDTQDLDTRGNSLFNSVANDLNIDMREYWYPNDAYLSKLSKSQLCAINDKNRDNFAVKCNVSKWKKSEVLTHLRTHFAQRFNNEADKEKLWLPDVMKFPAIDPDKAIDDTPVEEADLGKVA